MKTYKTEKGTLIIEAYEENNKYYLAIYKKHSMLCATRSGKTTVENYTTKNLKEFKTPQSANNYFKAIKQNNPTLKIMED